MKKILAPLAVAAFSVASLGMLAAPAQASTSYGGCTVAPRPIEFYDFNSSGQKRVVLRTDLSCHVDRWVLLSQQGWEDDDKPSDRVDDHWYSKTQWVRVHAGTPVRINTVVPMPDTPHDGWEELYQQARYQVRTIEQYPVTSAWTGWEATSTRSIPN
jgi:hypothetical protein